MLQRWRPSIDRATPFFAGGNFHALSRISQALQLLTRLPDRMYSPESWLSRDKYSLPHQNSAVNILGDEYII